MSNPESLPFPASIDEYQAQAEELFKNVHARQ